MCVCVWGGGGGGGGGHQAGVGAAETAGAGYVARFRLRPGRLALVRRRSLVPLRHLSTGETGITWSALLISAGVVRAGLHTLSGSGQTIV